MNDIPDPGDGNDPPITVGAPVIAPDSIPGSHIPVVGGQIPAIICRNMRHHGHETLVAGVLSLVSIAIDEHTVGSSRQRVQPVCNPSSRRGRSWRNVTGGRLAILTWLGRLNSRLHNVGRLRLDHLSFVGPRHRLRHRLEPSVAYRPLQRCGCGIVPVIQPMITWRAPVDANSTSACIRDRRSGSCSLSAALLELCAGWRS